MRDKINYKNLNELIKTGRNLLKICLVVAIGILVMLGFLIIEKTHLLNFVLTILAIILPLFIGLGVAWLFEPLILKLEAKKISRTFSTTIVYLSFVLILGLLLVLVVPEFVSQLKELVSQAPLFLTKFQNLITDLFSNFDGKGLDIEGIKSDITSQIENVVNNITSNSLTSVLNGITTFVTEGFNVILGILIGFYLSLSFHKVGNGINDLVPKKHKTDVKRILDELNEMAGVTDFESAFIHIVKEGAV